MIPVRVCLDRRAAYDDRSCVPHIYGHRPDRGADGLHPTAFYLRSARRNGDGASAYRGGHQRGRKPQTADSTPTV